MINGTFDPIRCKWREVTAEQDSPCFVHRDYTILGRDLEAIV